MRNALWRTGIRIRLDSLSHAPLPPCANVERVPTEALRDPPSLEHDPIITQPPPWYLSALANTRGATSSLEPRQLARDGSWKRQVAPSVIDFTNQFPPLGMGAAFTAALLSLSGFLFLLPFLASFLFLRSSLRFSLGFSLRAPFISPNLVDGAGGFPAKPVARAPLMCFSPPRFLSSLLGCWWRAAPLFSSWEFSGSFVPRGVRSFSFVSLYPGRKNRALCGRPGTTDDVRGAAPAAAFAGLMIHRRGPSFVLSSRALRELRSSPNASCVRSLASLSDAARAATLAVNWAPLPIFPLFSFLGAARCARGLSKSNEN